VTFNSEVTVISDGSKPPQVLAGDKLKDQAQLQSIGSEFSIDRPVCDSAAELSTKLYALEETGQTALGPALLVSIAMAAKSPGSRVVVCTDGLANVGLGALEGGGWYWGCSAWGPPGSWAAEHWRSGCL
jgi:hypothetical protein